MNKTITALFLLALMAAHSAAQSKNQTPFPSNPDGFREFVLDKTTAEEIIKSLGKPEKDKADKLEVSKIDGLTQSIKKRCSGNLPITTSATFSK